MSQTLLEEIRKCFELKENDNIMQHKNICGRELKQHFVGNWEHNIPMLEQRKYF